MVQISTIREFLNHYMKDKQNQRVFNLENVIDDFVLLCFIVGNDFLPPIPGFNIRMAGIDILLNFYKFNLIKMVGYLTKECDVNLKNLDLFFRELAKKEYQLLRAIEDRELNRLDWARKRETTQINNCQNDIEIMKRNNLGESKNDKKYKTFRQKKKLKNLKESDIKNLIKNQMNL